MKHAEAKRDNGEIVAHLVMGAIYVYVIIGGAWGLYFEYQYAMEEGFIKWVFWGSYVAGFKAMVWPYYAWQWYRR